MFRMILLMTRGIVLDARSRRWAMFILLIAALAMLFVGSTFLAGVLPIPWGFIVYWGICAWLTFAALMLALFDMLLVRAAARRERRQLEKKILDHPPEDEH